MNLIYFCKGLGLAGWLALALNAQAQSFSYQTGDVLVCFRNSSSGMDLVVNAGSFAGFTNLTPNQRIILSAYSGDQLAEVGTNSTGWSAFASLDDFTLFVTRPRVFPATPTSAWLNKTAANQEQTAARMNSVVVGAGANRTFNVLNTAAAVIEQDNSVGNPNFPVGRSYRDALLGNGSLANFANTFQGTVENTTSSIFTESGAVQRSDFYRLNPTGSGQATYLGYFELNTNGVMSYVAYPTSTPVIKGMVRTGETTTVYYTAGLYGTYKLRATNSTGISAPPANWPAIATLVGGDNVQHSITDLSTNLDRFYILSAE